MKFEPKSEKEVSNANLLPLGTYDAEVGTAEDKVSAAGNEMIKLDLSVYDATGKTHFVYDYLLEALAYKLRHAAEACGLLERYEAGNLEAEDFIGKTCKVKIKVQVDKDGKYPDKNVIQDYVIPAKKVQSISKDAIEEMLDDEIVF